MKKFNYRLIALLCLLLIVSCSPRQAERVPSTVGDVMDEVITRLYANVSPEKYAAIDDTFVLAFLTKDEREILATKYLSFTVNVPAVVSVMRDRGQKTLPFWLEPSGFVKTSMLVKSESYEYEVWQKEFDAGQVGLGINGFDKHRPVYFISVAPKTATDEVQISNVYPDYAIHTLQKGAFTYHDWSDLKLIEVPPALEGQKLFTTVRGRAREAHIKDAFRVTPYPSSQKPDHVLLTWSASPQTTIDIQWRSDTTVSDGIVKYWSDAPSTADTAVARAFVHRIQDRMLMNDRYVNRFTAQLTGLASGKKYSYMVGSQIGGWSEVSSFKTEPRHADEFSFVWFGDTHCFPDSGKLVNLASRHEEAAFFSIAGDLVTTGLNRDDWDRLFQHSGKSFANKALMPVPGNHDRQDGLGARLYYDLFSLPGNGPEGVDRESTYAFEYGNALFLMIDATSDLDAHTPWIEQQLKSSHAVWKFAMFHFPPYNYEEPYPDIQQAWVPLFDRYHVDMVMGGHIHYYMRSHPMKSGKVVPSYKDGTVYAISISIPAKHENMTAEPYAVLQYPDGYYYQHMELSEDLLKYTAFDENGEIVDTFSIRK